MVQSKDLDIVRGKALIHGASEDLLSIQSQVKPFYGLFDFMSTWPWVGKYAGQTEPVVEYAVHLVSAVDNLAYLADPMNDGPLYEKRSFQVVKQINANQDRVIAAELHLQQAERSYQNIELSTFPEDIQEKLQKTWQMQPLMIEAIAALKLVPAMTGSSKPVTYLVILQNSDELRPTGGFITSFGLVRMEQGVVTLLEFEDSTKTSYISEWVNAPEPLKQILMAHYWLARDANWSPSFPESAEQVSHLYSLTRGVETDGVIALNQASLEALLSFTGPINVNGKNVSTENVRAYMISEKMEAIEAGEAVNRKEFITPLVKSLIENVSQKVGKDNLIQFTKLTLQMAKQGNLLIYSKNPDIENLLTKYQLDGELHPGAGDNLMLVDANIGYSKLDQVVKPFCDLYC